MKIITIIPNYPPINILQPEEYYHYVYADNETRVGKVTFVEYEPSKYRRETCSGVACELCPFLEYSYRDYRIPLDQDYYDDHNCSRIDENLFINSVLTPPRLAKTKELHARTNT